MFIYEALVPFIGYFLVGYQDLCTEYGAGFDRSRGVVMQVLAATV
jgi:hypothetical protein